MTNRSLNSGRLWKRRSGPSGNPNRAISSWPDDSISSSSCADLSCTSSSTLGCAAPNWMNRSDSSCGPMVHITPIFRVAVSSFFRLLAWLRAASVCDWMPSK